MSENDPKFADVSRVLKLFLGEEGPWESSAEYRVFCKYLMSGYHYVEARFVHPTANSTFGIIAFNLCRLLPSWWDQSLDPSKLNSRGDDLLIIAAHFGHISACDELLRRGFKINRDVNRFTQSPLAVAIESWKIDLVRFLLENGADPDLATDGHSLLCVASWVGPAYVRAMLSAGVSPNILCGKCKWGCALARAAYEGYEVSVERLIKAGADLNPRFANPGLPSPLEWSLRAGLRPYPYDRHRLLDCITLLLKHGADANASIHGSYRGKFYDSMLEAAATGLVPESIRLLVEHGADVETPLTCLGYNNILEYVVVEGDVDLARFLVGHGADVHSRLATGKHDSLLVAATVERGSSLDMVRFLVEEALVDLEQLKWMPSQVAPNIKRRGKSPASWSSLEYAERRKYLTDVHQVDNQVLLDLEAYYG